MDTELGERLILQKLSEQGKQLNKIEERLRHIEISVGILQAKAALIGGIAGLIPSVILWLISRG